MTKGGGGLAAKAGAVANAPGSGRFIGSQGLTEQQAAFVQAYVSNGGNGPAACRTAGYANERDSWRLLRNEAIQQAVRGEFERRVRTEGVAVGLSTLLAVATDKGQSGNARTAASKELLRLAGYGAREQLPELEDKPLSERTLAELDAFIAGGNARLQELQELEDRTLDGDSRRITHAIDAISD